MGNLGPSTENQVPRKLLQDLRESVNCIVANKHWVSEGDKKWGGRDSPGKKSQCQATVVTERCMLGEKNKKETSREVLGGYRIGSKAGSGLYRYALRTTA